MPWHLVALIYLAAVANGILLGLLMIWVSRKIERLFREKR